MGNIAIIPARSGSKGLKNKNILDLNGKPLIAYTIEAAIKSECFDEIMVSTDSEEYAEIAKKWGAKVPFLRSSENASDTASSWDMVQEVLNKYRDKNIEFDSFCLLQPTSPLRTFEDIKNAYCIYEKKASFAVVSVCEMEHSPLWCGQLPTNNEFVDFIPKSAMIRRQETGIFYRINGAIYIVNTERFLMDRYLYQAGSFAYIMEQEKSIDIDTALDLKLASVLLNEMNL